MKNYIKNPMFASISNSLDAKDALRRLHDTKQDLEEIAKSLTAMEAEFAHDSDSAGSFARLISFRLIW